MQLAYRLDYITDLPDDIEAAKYGAVCSQSFSLRKIETDASLPSSLEINSLLDGRLTLKNTNEIISDEVIIVIETSDGTNTQPLEVTGVTVSK